MNLLWLGEGSAKAWQVHDLLGGLGFNERISGDHHIFYKNGIEEIVNLQLKGVLAKPYQIKQVRNIILKYCLGGGADA